LVTQIRENISKYYEGWTICDDPTCGNRTRMMGVYGRRCLRQGCRGTVTFEVSSSRFDTLWHIFIDGQICSVFGRIPIQPATLLLIPIQCGEGCQGSCGHIKAWFVWVFLPFVHRLTFERNIDEVTTVTFANGEFLRTMTDTVDKYMDQCGRRWVELSSIFSFMKI